jgi:hypothetical protein
VRKPSVTKVNPKITTCVHTVRSGSTNWGKNVRKKRAVFGLRTFTTAPCVNRRESG